MLLPSDVARVVLGYLQWEGLSSTSQIFINESPHLKEYAEHSTEDGAIPACVFSLCGKNLTTILNEYAAAKAKETSHEVPVMMTSLWKKLDFTLNQIKSLQNSPAISALQRVRSRAGLANMTRQRSVTMTPASTVLCSTAPFRGSINTSMTNTQINSITNSQSLPSPSTSVVSLSSTHLQIQDGGILSVSRDSPMQIPIPVPEPRLAPSTVSRGGRKWDFPKRRGGGIGGGSGPTGRPSTSVGGSAAEQQADEVVNENFPQLVIQNAREKILSDTFLQEKLAENINKILASDPTPQTSKASCGTVEPDPSIDEILGLQGEIHMSDDAIHDILEQTESDPAFQALFDLFDYNKGKGLDTEDMSTSLEDNNATGTAPDTRPLMTEVNPGNATGGVLIVSDATAISADKTAQEPMTRKTRKSIVPCSTKKTVLVHRGSTSRLVKNTPRLLQPIVSSTVAVNSKRTEKKAALTVSEVAVPMDIDEAFTVPAPPSDLSSSQAAAELARKVSCTLIPSLPNAQTVTNSTSSSIGSVALETTSSSNVTLIQKDKAPSSSKKTNSKDVYKAQAPSSSSTVPCPLLSMAPALAQHSNKNLSPSITLPPPIASAIAPIASVIGSVSPTLTSATPISTSVVPALPSPHINNQTDPHKREADPNNIVSLKIIISDDQMETPPPTSNILNQAISSISGDKIPTIFLSSPANSPSKFPVGPPGTPRTNQEEIMQAVSSLQSSEVFQPALTEAPPPLSGLAQLAPSPSQGQPSYIIQLPVDAANPALPGASYFIVTDPGATQDPQTRPLLLPAGVSQGQPLPANQYAVATPPRTQGYPSGSTFFLQSPGRPMMVPLSMIGQTNVGKLPLVSNQFVAIPSPVAKQHPEPAKPKAPTHKAALKPPTISKTGEQKVSKGQPTEKAESPNAPDGTSPSHKRILQFDSARVPSAPPPPPTPPPLPPTSNTSPSCPAEQPGKVSPKLVQRLKPAILGGDRAKRRIATIRCTTEAQAKFAISEETENKLDSQPQQQRENVKKTPRKQDHKGQVTTTAADQTNMADVTEPGPVNETESERLKSKEKRRSSSTKGNPALPNDSHDVQGSTSSASNSSAKTSSRKDSNGGPRKDPTDKGPGKSREVQPEKKNAPEPSNVRANKENEKAQGDGAEHHPEVERRAALLILPAAALPPKPSKTSTLSKQAAEMLQDIQGLNPPTTPAKRTTSGTADTPLSPRAGRSREEPTDGIRTPVRQRLLRDGEGTPRRLIAPGTPDLPTCSPASEAGSESSINMAAHTLMILSRTAIARTGSPLKDSLRQDEVGEMSPPSAKQAKKRKRTATPSSVAGKNEPKGSSSSKKKEKKQKKAVDTFPDDLDVDKFLSLLHYDE
ncbi:unnamed protein product [Gadus morhua 'NCC']